MSTMIESLAQARHAERYANVRAVATDGEVATGGEVATDGEVATGGEAPARWQTTRTRAGWLLVGLGLRLALPSHHDTCRRITLIRR